MWIRSPRLRVIVTLGVALACAASVLWISSRGPKKSAHTPRVAPESGAPTAYWLALAGSPDDSDYVERWFAGSGVRFKRLDSVSDLVPSRGDLLVLRGGDLALGPGLAHLAERDERSLKSLPAALPVLALGARALRAIQHVHPDFGYSNFIVFHTNSPLMLDQHPGEPATVAEPLVVRINDISGVRPVGLHARSMDRLRIAAGVRVKSVVSLRHKPEYSVVGRAGSVAFVGLPGSVGEWPAGIVAAVSRLALELATSRGAPGPETDGG